MKGRVVFVLEIILMAAVGLAKEASPSLTELSLEELMKVEVATVYGASKFEQKVTEAPSSVTIITSDEIKRYGYRTLADILKSVRGFFVTSDRNYSYAGVRGFGRPGDYNSRILVLVDGHRVNDSIYDGVLIGTEFILDVDLIDRVEVIRGPSSSLYGTSAFFGVINIITRSWKSVKGPEISGEAGNFGSHKGRASFGYQLQNGLAMLLSGSYSNSEGQDRLFFREFADPATNNGFAEDVDSDKAYSLFSKFNFRDFTLEGAHVSREKVIPTASFGTVFNDPRNRTTDALTFLDLKYEHLFERQIGVIARVFYDRYYYHGDYVFDRGGAGFPGDFVLNKDLAWGYWWGGEVQVSKKIFDKYQLILGAEYRDNFRQDQENFDENPPLLYMDDKRNSQNWALYFQAEVPILQNLRLNAGLRHDHFETFGGTTNPRLALIYSPFEKTFLKFLYGEAFRAPNVFELFYNDGGITQKASPDLEPEEIRTYELALEQYFGKYLRGVASVFYYRIKNLISQQIDPTDNLLVFRNVDEIEAKGLELELEGKWASGLIGRLSYSFQMAKDRQTESRLSNSPRHLGKFNVSVPLLKEKLFASLEEQITSRRKTLAGNEVDSFFVTNLTLFSQSLVKGVDLSVSVYNLFDKKYADPGASEHLQDFLRQDGRTLRLKATYRF